MSYTVYVRSDRLEARGVPDGLRQILTRRSLAQRWSVHLDDPALLANALKDLLSAADFGRRVEFIISDAWCHYQVVARPLGVSAVRQLDSIRRIRFQNALGENVASLRLASFAPPFASTDIVAGLDESIIDRLMSGVAQAGKRATIMRPYWVACARETPSENKRMHWIVACEGTSRTLGLFDGRRCVGIRRTRQGATETLGTSIARELALYEGAHLANRAYVWGREPMISGDLPSVDLEVCLQGEPSSLASGEEMPGRATS